MEGKSFNEVLKAREKEAGAKTSGSSEHIALDDTQRVKVLSPGRLVFNRFIRNKLAIVGSAILIFMFLFSFLFPVFYKYDQTDIFYKYDSLMTNYASAAERESYTHYQVDDEHTVSSVTRNKLTSYIDDMEADGIESREVVEEDSELVYNLNRLGDNVYELTGVAVEAVGSLSGFEQAATFNAKNGKCLASGEGDINAGFEAAIAAAVEQSESGFEYGGKVYSVSSTGKKGLYSVYDLSGSVLTMADGSEADAALREALLDNLGSGEFELDGVKYGVENSGDSYSLVTYGNDAPLIISTRYVFDSYEQGRAFSDEFKAAALMALYGDGKFSADGEDYSIGADGEDVVITGSEGDVAMLSTFSVKRYSGEDSLSIDFKRTAREKIEAMAAEGKTTDTFVYALPMMDSEGVYVLNEDGSYTLEDSEITVMRKEGQYVFSCEQTTHLIDIYAPSSREHLFGTDADGMDVLARMMYGGRISLMVGFIVIIIELIFGVILGGLAGFFSGWVDTLIMRLVDIFNCIPTMPILIILGAIFDDQKLSSYVRLMWMMAVLGFLGWAGVARLVRGQILSLREQEFMTAAEATGISTRRRIFRHLVPNVMPQLIVNATMGLGSVIIYESTLSFLGLGVKHPLATWGTMINSVTSSNENMVRYAYIWIPVGMLICLTVIAFNFVGDGLRDAFDPKMK